MITRRTFLGAGAAILTGCATVSKTKGETAAMGIFPEYRDDVTGARVRDLTPGDARSWVVYQTHPMWTPGMTHLMYYSDRDQKSSIWAVEMATGEARMIEGPNGGSVLARKDDRLYFLRDRTVYRKRLLEAFAGKEAVEEVATLPSFATHTNGGLSLDAEEGVLYTGAALENSKRNAILALHLRSGGWRKVCEVDFQIGHVQASPFRSSEIMFCWETGGDAPQRTWFVNANGTGLRPAYPETYEEWVTHEVWWSPDRIIFTVWPYDEERTRKPHGILSADVKTGVPTIHTQYRAWHTHGSPDGRWILGDDFDRNLWLVKADTGERRLLTQGHKAEDQTTHPHASFTPDSKAIVFTSSRGGIDHVYLVDLPERWESLPPA